MEIWNRSVRISNVVLFKSNTRILINQFLGVIYAIYLMYPQLRHLSVLQNSNKTPNKFSTYQVKITFKHSNFVPSHFKYDPPPHHHHHPDCEHLNFRIFSSILQHKYPGNLFNKKLHTLIKSSLKFVQFCMHPVWLPTGIMQNFSF